MCIIREIDYAHEERTLAAVIELLERMETNLRNPESFRESIESTQENYRKFKNASKTDIKNFELTWAYSNLCDSLYFFIDAMVNSIAVTENEGGSSIGKIKMLSYVTSIYYKTKARFVAITRFLDEN